MIFVFYKKYVDTLDILWYNMIKERDNEMKNNNFILLMGKSGTGKSTIAQELYKRYGLSSIESYTTREPRYPNESGHIFVTNEQFDELENMVGFTTFCGNRYCATAEQVEENDIYIIDPDGVEYFMETYIGNKTPIVIYLEFPISVCYDRLVLRDGAEEAERRKENDNEIFTNAKFLADEILREPDTDICVEEIYKIWKDGMR